MIERNSVGEIIISGVKAVMRFSKVEIKAGSTGITECGEKYRTTK